MLGDVDGDGDVTADDIASMTLEQAKRIIKAYWWEPHLFYAILSEEVVSRVFAFCFNMGMRSGIRLLQKAINSTGKFERLAEDGILGRKTVAATNTFNPDVLVPLIQQEAWKRYEHLIKRNPSLKVFEKGWRRRAFD